MDVLGHLRYRRYGTAGIIKSRKVFDWRRGGDIAAPRFIRSEVKMKTIRSLVIALALVLSFALVACGGGRSRMNIRCSIMRL